jgi:MFS family permease
MDNIWRKNLYVLWAGVFLCSSAYSMAIPFLPLFMNQDLGVEKHLEMWSGLAFGITFLASALISPYWGSLADKYGRKPMILRAGFCLFILYLLCYFVRNPYELLAVRLLQGLLTGYVPSATALIATNTPERNVGYALGVMSTAGASGGIIGPLIGGAVSQFIGFRNSFLAAGMLVLAATLIAWLWVKEVNFNRNKARSHVWNDLKEAAANKPLMRVMFTTMFVGSSVMVLEPLLTIYVLELGADRQSASLSSGLIFSAVGIATVLAAPQWGRIGTRIGFQRTLVIGLLGGALGNLLQVFFHSLFGFGALRFGYGLFFAAVYPSLNAMIVKATPAEFRGRAFSLNQSANQLGTMVGPLIGGALGGWISIPFVFVLTGFALCCAAWFSRLGWKRQPPSASVSG